MELKRCETPELANCEAGITTTSATTATPSFDPRCPSIEDPYNPVHLPHEYDCEYFYKCDNMKLVLFRCPDNLHWRFELQTN